MLFIDFTEMYSSKVTGSIKSKKNFIYSIFICVSIFLHFFHCAIRIRLWFYSLVYLTILRLSYLNHHKKGNFYSINISLLIDLMDCFYSINPHQFLSPKNRLLSRNLEGGRIYSRFRSISH